MENQTVTASTAQSFGAVLYLGQVQGQRPYFFVVDEKTQTVGIGSREDQADKPKD